MITLSDLLYKVTWSGNGVAGVCRGSDTLIEVQYIYTKLGNGHLPSCHKWADRKYHSLCNKLVEITVQLLFFMPLLS